MAFTEKEREIIKKHTRGNLVIVTEDLLIALLKERGLVKHIVTLTNLQELFIIKCRSDVFYHMFNIIIHTLTAFNDKLIGFDTLNGALSNDVFLLTKERLETIHDEKICKKAYSIIYRIFGRKKPFEENTDICVALLVGVNDYVENLILTMSINSKE